MNVILIIAAYKFMLWSERLMWQVTSDIDEDTRGTKLRFLYNIIVPAACIMSLLAAPFRILKYAVDRS